MSKIFQNLQSMAKDIMVDDDYFTDIDVLTEDLHDIQNRIRVALSKIGLCCIVYTPEADVKYPNAPGPMFEPMKLHVGINEFVLKNRGDAGTKIPASEVAERVAWLLHHPNHPTRDDATQLVCERIRLIPDKQFVVYRVEFAGLGSLDGITSE